MHNYNNMRTQLWLSRLDRERQYYGVSFETLISILRLTSQIFFFLIWKYFVDSNNYDMNKSFNVEIGLVSLNKQEGKKDI